MKNRVHFISTKLKMPAPRKNYIPRKALISKLRELMEYKVTLIQGAAGSGKTTLMASYIKETNLTSCKWLTIDAETDVFSFWYYFLEAVKEYLGDEKDQILSMFESILHKEDIEKIIVILINRLSTEDDFAVVLDDFHHIHDEVLLKTIQFFINNSSDNVRLVLLTRESPVLYLGELRMSGRLLEIGNDGLKFSFDEGACFLKDILNVELDSQVIAKINDLAEGWVGGLQLIALALASKQKSFIHDIKGLNKYVIEYLTQEILASLNEQEKDFLINTSILSYFNQRICDEVLEQDNSQEIIDTLLEKNLFIMEIDDGEAYRYHHIFHEFLRQQFCRLNPGSRKKNHHRAALAYEKIGDLDESIKHYLIIEHFQDALAVVEKMGQNPKGWSYLKQIPLQWIAGYKELAWQRFFYHYCHLEFDQCEQLLQVLDGELAKALLEQRYLKVDHSFFSELDQMNFSLVTKAIILLNISIFLAIQHEHEKALEILGEVMAIENKRSNPYFKVGALTLMSQLKEDQGELKESLEIYEQTLCLIEENPLLAPMAANSLIGMAGIYLKNFNLDLAEQSLAKSRAMIDKSYPILDNAYYITLIELKCLAGEINEAKELFKLKAGDLEKSFLFIHNLFKQLAFIKVDKDVFDRFVQTCAEYTQQNNNRIEDKFILIRVLFLQNKVEEALELADQVLEFTRRNKIKGYLIQGILLKMSVLDSLGSASHREIINLLREAVYYSYDNKIISPYVFEKELVRKYIFRLKEERRKDLNVKERSFVNQLMGMIQQEKTESLLTEREIEVLSVLASGATNKQIADTLYISTATVKTHIINIYSKLQVANRVEAVERAKEEGLI